MIRTADLYDHYAEKLQIAAPIFTNFGGCESFSGSIVTLKVFEDNTLVRSTLESNGSGKTLVIDGGGSLRCALLGDNLAKIAYENSWSGLIINGCVRDSRELLNIGIGIKALACNPAKSNKRGEGQSGININFAGVNFIPGQHLWSDSDGIVVATTILTEK